jgi:hypothetical protein
MRMGRLAQTKPSRWSSSSRKQHDVA